jgi:hypothetical protein
MTATIWIAVCVFAIGMTLAVIGLFAIMEFVEKYIDGGCGCDEDKEGKTQKHLRPK